MKRLVVVCLSVLFTVYGYSQKRMSRAEYIDKYASLAIKEMQRTGIPASIKLAQACLESDNGNSALSLSSNNHFGIKCHSSWTGKKVYFDDDAKGECFRVYPQVLDSYIDHSEFLKNGQRYSFLFSLPANDYKSWAHGLKKAGYATNPNYAQLLIRIIEDNELFKYDQADAYTIAAKSQDVENEKDAKRLFVGSAPASLVAPPKPIENKSIKMQFGREIFKNNGVEFIILKDNESIFMVSKMFSIPVWKLYYYNDLKPGQQLHAGDIVYIEQKKHRAEKPYISHKVEPGESFHDISQLYAVKVQNLAKMNNAKRDNELQEGKNIFVRKHLIQFQ